MQHIKVLWVDDEIDSLKPLILFLEKKGAEVVKQSNGYDALDYLESHTVDVVLLDESMPGLPGLETLAEIKKKKPNLPVIMITKNEEEYIMEEAIGSQISDYLIKPVNPNQVWLSLKKQFDSKRLVSEKTNQNYQQAFRELFMKFNERPDFDQWKDIYREIINWEMKLDANTEMEMYDVIVNQKSDANVEFAKYVSNNYIDWVNGKQNAPLLSPFVLKQSLFPILNREVPTVLLVMDNLRYDQWLTIKPLIEELFVVTDEDMYCAILPTTTQYARNALFAGMMPKDIVEKFPAEWTYDDEDGGKNLYESHFLEYNLQREGIPYEFEFHKITNFNSAKKLEDKANNLLQKQLSVVVYNFVDMMSHVRTEMEVLKELASDDFALRALTLSWFRHSPLYNFLKKISEKSVQLVLTTDHGSIQVKNAIKVKGDRDTTTNLRFKHGKSLNYPDKAVMAVKNPFDAKLPKPEVNSSYIFAKSYDFLCYPNNYSYYKNYYHNTYQHGGLSLEEMLVPLISLKSKSIIA